MTVYNITVSQVLPLTQGLGSNPFGQQVAQTLSIVETVKVMPAKIAVGQTLTLGQNVTCRQSIRHISVTQGLELRHSGARSAAFETFTQFLHMWHSAKVVEFEQVFQVLTLHQTAIAVRAKGASNTLTLTQAVSFTMIRNLSVVDFLTLNHGATGYLQDEDTYSVVIPEFNGPNAPEC